MGNINEIGKIIVSIVLLGLVGFLYSLGFSAAEVALKLGATNTASLIIGAELVYWLKPT